MLIDTLTLWVSFYQFQKTKNEAFLFQQLLLNDPQKVHALKLHFEVSMSNRRLQLRKFGSLTNQSNKQTAGEPIKIRQYMSVTEGAGKFGRVASNDLHLIGLKKIAWDFLANHWAKELRLAQAILLIELIGLT